MQQKGTGRPLTSPPTDREEETLGRSGSDREDGSWVSKELRLPKAQHDFVGVVGSWILLVGVRWEGGLVCDSLLSGCVD